MKLTELLERYSLFRILKPKTLVGHKTVITSFEQYMGREATLDDLTVENLLRHRAHVLKHLAPISYNSYRRHLFTLARFAVEEGLMKTNPFYKVLPAPAMKRLPKVLPVNVRNNVKQLLDAPPDEHESVSPMAPRWFWNIVCETLGLTGIRRRQLIGMIWDDIDFDGKTILLRAETSKTRREWIIPLPDKLRPLLEQLYEETKKCRGDVRPDDQVFCRPLFAPNTRFKKKKMDQEHLAAFFKGLQRATKSKVSAHKFRHTFATRVVNKSGNFKSAQYVLGHTDIRSTLGYVHPDMDEISRLMNG